MKAREILTLFGTSILIMAAILYVLSNFEKWDFPTKVLVCMVPAAVIVALTQIVLPGIRMARDEKKVLEFTKAHLLPKNWDILSLYASTHGADLYSVEFVAIYLPLEKSYKFYADVELGKNNGGVSLVGGRNSSIAHQLNRKEKEWASEAGTDVATIRKQWKRDSVLNELGI